MELLGKMVKEIFTYSDIILYWDIQDKNQRMNNTMYILMAN